MFRGVFNVEEIDLGNNFDVSNVTNMVGMFEANIYLSKLVLGEKFDISNFPMDSDNHYAMFNGTGNAVSVVDIYLPSASIENLTTMMNYDNNNHHFNFIPY